MDSRKVDSVGSRSLSWSRMGSFSAWNWTFSSSSLSDFTCASRSLMAATDGSNFLTSRSCLVPINRAMTLSITLATSMGFSLFPVTPIGPAAMKRSQIGQREHFILSVSMGLRQTGGLEGGWERKEGKMERRKERRAQHAAPLQRRQRREGLRD